MDDEVKPGQLYSWIRSESALISYWKVVRVEDRYIWVSGGKTKEEIPIPRVYFNSWFKRVTIKVVKSWRAV